jgi:photosystem II stability/assembly factor-like uncharacterized protein
MFFTNINTGWACGIAGLMKKTTNGGTIWESQSAGTGNLQDVYFLNSLTGWTCGVGTIFKTTNGGTNWTLMHTQDQSISAIFFIDSLNGWCAGHNGIIRTSTNGGANWTLQTSGVSSILSSIYFLNPSTGWICGINGVIRKTTNGGINWLEQNTGITNTLSTITFINQLTGWAVGLNGRIIKTTNAGESWISQATGVNIFLTGVSFCNENTGWVSGERTILVTTNGGANWNKQVTNVMGRINHIQFKDKNRGWAVADSGRILTTFTGGFEVAAPILTSPANGILNTPVTPMLQWGAVPNSSGYNIQVSADSNFTSPAINDTSAAGASYTPLPGTLSGSTKYYWRVSAKHPAGAGYYSDTWSFTTASAPSTPNLLLPANNAAGQVLTPLLDWDSTGNIVTFRAQVSTDSLFTAPNFDTVISRSQVTVPNGRLFANTKYYWRVMASGPGGNTGWSNKRSFTTAPTAPSAPALLSPANNSIGQSAALLLDWDSTANITAFRVQVSPDSLFSAAAFDTTLSRSQVTVPNGRLFANTKYFWRVMASGPGGSSSWSMVWNFTTTLTGVSQSGSNIPAEFKLYNNYPNPFNPVTQIKYDLPEGSNVKLVIYDILGKEVIKLVNEFKPAGSYTVQFNAEALTSGVYFYRIETQGFKDIKRMLLLK